MQQLPPGWAIHPQDGRYAYEVANPQNMQPTTAFGAPVAQSAPSDPFAGYQNPNIEEWTKQQETAVRQTMGWAEQDKNVVFIDFKPSKQMAVGEECAITVRLMPDRNLPAAELLRISAQLRAAGAEKILISTERALR